MRGLRKVICAVGLVLWTIALVACGNKNAASTQDKSGTDSGSKAVTEKAMVDDADYRAAIEKIDSEESGPISTYTSLKFAKDGKLYSTVSIYNSETEESIEGIRITDEKTGEQVCDDIVPGFENEHTYIVSLALAGDEAFVFGAYTYGDMGQNQEMWIGKCDKDGTILNMVNYKDYPGAADEQYLSNNILCDGTYTYIEAGEKLLLLDENLRYKKSLMDVNYPNMCIGNDGLLYIFKDYNGALSCYNPDTDKLEEEIETFSSASYIYAGGEDELFISTNSSLKSFNTKTRESMKLFDYLDIDLTNQGFEYMYRVSDSEIVIYFYITEERDETMEDGTVQRMNMLVPKRAVVKRYEKGELPEIETINLAIFFTNPSITKAVSEYNQAHPDTKIKIKCYYDDYSDWTEMQEAFDRDVLENVGYDIILFDTAEPTKYSDKGLLEDLMPIMKADASFDLSDYYEQILLADVRDGKAYSIAEGAYLFGFMGNEEVFGDKEKLSTEDIYNARDKLRDIRFLAYGTNANVVTMMLQNDYRLFLGGEEGVFNFDTKEFRDLCEFAATFPDWKEGTDDEYLTVYNDMKDKKTVLMQEYISGGESYLLDRARAGKGVRAYGFPSSEGNGYYIRPAGRYAINAFSNHKEEAWEIIKILLNAEPEYFGSSFRASKAAYKAEMDNLYNWCNNSSEYGGKVIMNGEEIRLSMTEDDIKIFENMIEGATYMHQADDMIFEIIGDEIGSYFSKEKSLDDVINVIQKRVNLYLEEKR